MPISEKEPGVQRLIESSPFGDKISFLLSNKGLGMEPIFQEKLEYSNCHGTVIYLLGLEGFIEAEWGRRWRDFSDENKQIGYPKERVVFPKDRSRPGWGLGKSQWKCFFLHMKG